MRTYPTQKKKNHLKPIEELIVNSTEIFEITDKPPTLNPKGNSLRSGRINVRNNSKKSRYKIENCLFFNNDCRLTVPDADKIRTVLVQDVL